MLKEGEQSIPQEEELVQLWVCEGWKIRFQGHR